MGKFYWPTSCSCELCSSSEFSCETPFQNIWLTATKGSELVLKTPEEHSSKSDKSVMLCSLDTAWLFVRVLTYYISWARTDPEGEKVKAKSKTVVAIPLQYACTDNKANREYKPVLGTNFRKWKSVAVAILKFIIGDRSMRSLTYFSSFRSAGPTPHSIPVNFV